LARFAEIAMGIFILVFIAVCWRALARPRPEMRRAAMLPLDDDSTSRSAGGAR
jgi:cbb3-type cytochrome oxidase subunit 3